MEAKQSKIFGIGLSKTGTSSLARALDILGYRTKDYIGAVQYIPGDLTSLDRDVLVANDAFTDTPIPSFYRELDAAFPGSKFILTVRDTQSWLRSCQKQFSLKQAEKQSEAHRLLFHDLYGTNVFETQKFSSGYEKFVRTAEEYFKDRLGDLLVMNITAGDGWEKLCEFLSVPTPHLPFPKANVTQIRWLDVGKIVTMAKHAGEVLLCSVHTEESTTPARDGTALSAKTTKLFKGSFASIRRALWSMRGGDRGAIERAKSRAEKLVRSELRKLSPDIPVLSSLREPMPYSERAHHNHLWLVDLVNGLDDSLEAFTVNIALVEDGQPICGVVYVPLLDMAYFAKVGHGGYVLDSGGAQRKLNDSRSVCLTATEMPPGSESDCLGPNTKATADRLSPPLAICRVAEGKTGSARIDKRVFEWEIAAAHVVAACVGRRVRECDTGHSATYNKSTLAMDCLIVE